MKRVARRRPVPLPHPTLARASVERHLRLARSRIRAAAAFDHVANLAERGAAVAGTGTRSPRSRQARARAAEHREQAQALLATAREGAR